MSARAIFRATLVIGSTKLPVRLYSAARDRRVHFRLLHEPDHQPVKQEMIHADTEEPVATREIQRGYEVEPGRFVILKREELARLEPEPDRNMRALHFIARDQLPHMWLDRPYLLGPDGDAPGYFALAEALGDSDMAGIVHWTMRKHHYHGALLTDGEYLMVMTLHAAEELVEAPTVDVSTKGIDDKQIALARQLVETLRAPFEPDAYHDEYREKVEQLIASKAAGKKVRRLRPKAAEETDDLARALRQSLKKAKEKRVA
ncbi:MAG TPA: Ku protein [Polyangiaceae bacterium]|nr:Ku protein [Polyangiaceae bacterium]